MPDSKFKISKLINDYGTIELSALKDDGFKLSEIKNNLTGLALFSLSIALKSFSSTYKDLYNSEFFWGKDHSTTLEDLDYGYRKSYFINCAETIIHFQHFIELVFKDLLRKEHPLLANDASNKTIILRKLLLKQDITDLEMEKINSVEFGVAANRVEELIREERIGAGKYDFILTNMDWIRALNVLRNRIWHRGTFLLRYPSLDTLVGKFILPFVEEVIKLPQYKGLERFWKYSILHCGEDPIKLIIGKFKTNKYEIDAIAFYKELMRAAYENPMRNFFKGKNFTIGREIKDRAELLAKSLEKIEDIRHPVRICPVCGVYSLVSFDEFEGTFDDQNNLIEGGHYVFNVKCFCCSFEVFHQLGNPKEYGIKIDDFWSSEEM